MSTRSSDTTNKLPQLFSHLQLYEYELFLGSHSEYPATSSGDLLPAASGNPGSGMLVVTEERSFANRIAASALLCRNGSCRLSTMAAFPSTAPTGLLGSPSRENGPRLTCKHSLMAKVSIRDKGHDTVLRCQVEASRRRLAHQRDG